MKLLNNAAQWVVRKFPPQKPMPVLKRVGYFIMDFCMCLGFWTAVTALITGFMSLPITSVFALFLAALGVTAIWQTGGNISASRFEAQ